ncbi:F-actin-monooxygenase mical2 isoform X3 [Xenopus laevis]|uniref:F-actin monooxygenase n=1 Tax=Xenopus laevis TaxID=8355 RepID=A0A8J1MV79_XENLA|nr:F-actin-monooxygenase mical2 isoform X3 [Xenopus laevis]
MGENDYDKHGQAGQLFENFIQATTCKGTLQAFNILTRQLELDPQDHRHFYTKLKSKVTSWKAKALWNKLDKKHGQKEYKKGKACIGTKCLIIGGGPCGLRTAIELSCLGAKVVVVEKRDTFSRNNVLHLWPYTIHDLRCLGAKKFYGKFCAGAIDHISIWQLQLMLFKIALLHGVEIHVNVEFMKLLEPLEDQENQKIGWKAEFLPQDHPLSDYEFDVIIGADGRRNTLEGFRRKEFRGKLAIAITANFINRNTTAEAKVEEISGVAFIFNQKFFQDLKEETGIDLENIVYYKDSTHYFVMTAKKQSLLDKGVIINDYADAEMLLCTENVDQDNLQSYAREAADFATNYQLPSLDFAINHYEQPDVAMFDFTSMYASENAALVRERHGHQILVALVGDSLLEPFWPMGTGCARGFLAAFDTAWMVRSWAQGVPPLELLAERESLYRLLPQTTPENISKNFDQYTIDPGTRYPNLNSSCVRTHQVKHLFITNELQTCSLERASSIRRSVGVTRHESDVRPNKLLVWCQKQTEGYRNVSVTNLTSSWKSGLALCALIHRFRPELVEFSSLKEEDVVENNQLAFDIAEREFGISPMTTGKEMAAMEEPDKLSMVLYLSKFYELFRGTPLRPVDTTSKDNGDTRSSKPSNLIVNNYLNLTLPRKRVPKDEKTSEDSDLNKRRRTVFRCFEEPANVPSRNVNSGNECNDTKEVINQNKVKSMATQLLAKFEENAPNTSLRRQESLTLSDVDQAATAPLTDPPPVNPRFAKPPDPSPSLPQPETKRQFQAVGRTQSVVRPPVQSRPAPPKPTRELRVVQRAESHPDDLERSESFSSACPSALVLSNILERLQDLEEKAQQKRAQNLANREFHKKNIKEKAAHLASLFGSVDLPKNKLPSHGLSHHSPQIPYNSSRTPDPPPLLSSSSASESSPSSAPSKKIIALGVNAESRATKQSLFFPDPGQMTVGKVSSGIGAVAEVLVNLYMCDHKPKPKSPDLGSLRKEFPANIGGSDTCYFCKRRVYVVERLSAEGHFFHRECFKCAFCSTSIRLGNYVFNVEEGKFYCQPHFMHSFSKNKHRKRRTESKAQEEDKTWKSGEAEAAEVATDSAYSACSSSGESSPDEPTSPKKSRGNNQFKDFRRRASSVEWKSVRVAPQEEGAGHNLLAVRVMVMTDESSSDIECEVFEEAPNLQSKETLRVPPGRPLTQTKGTEKRIESSDQSTTSDTTAQTVPSNKHHRWRKKVLSTFPLITAKKSTRVSRESYSPGSSLDEEVFGRTEANGNMKPTNPLSWEERIPGVLSYVPHYKEVQDRTAHNDAGLPRTTGHQVLDHSREVNTFREYNQQGSWESKGAEQTGHRYHRDPMNSEVTGAKNPALKKLVLSKEEKSDLLEWRVSSEPRAPVGNRTERTASQANHDPGGETENKKSTFAILSNAIKRSFTKSISSAPDSPKKSPQKAKLESQGNYFDFPSSIFRRGRGNFECGVNGTEMDSITNRNSAKRSETTDHQDNGEVWESGHSQKSQRDPSSVRLDDMPRMLANVSIKENPSDGASRIASFRSRKNSLFSSLRLKSKTPEDSLHASSNETWSVFGSFRRKLSDKEPRPAPNFPSSARSVGLALKEENSSSSEDEFTSKNSRKASRELRHRRKMEKEAKQKAKQEELKRLHKAQTIQRQLQETEEKLRALEIQGVKLEKVLRGESDSGAHSESQLLHEWFQIALEKNKLNRYEAELLFTARELELEDQQGRLEQILREKMLIDPALKDEADNKEEQELFAEMMKIIEQRDQLVTSIEEQRVQESSVERNLQGLRRDHELKMSLIHKKRSFK